MSLARHRPTQDADALEMREVMAALAATATPAQVAVFRRMAGVLWRKAERHQVELRAMLQAMVDGLASKADIGDLKSMVGQLVAQGTTKRADFSAETRRDHENFARNRGGRCPGPGPCRSMVIQPGGTARAEWAEFDHIDGNRQNNETTNCWLICKECHDKKTSARTTPEANRFRAKYSAYQVDFEEQLPTQGKLIP